MIGLNVLAINIATLKDALTEYLASRITPAPIVKDIDFSKAAYESTLILNLETPAKDKEST